MGAAPGGVSTGSIHVPNDNRRPPPAAARVPSGANATHSVLSICQSKVLSGAPATASQSHTNPSLPVVATVRPSGANASPV